MVFILYRVLCPTARWPIPQVKKSLQLTVQLYRNIGNLASQSFVQLNFLVVRLKAVVAVSILIPCKFCAELPDPDVACFFPDPALWSQSQQLVTIGGSMLHRNDHKKQIAALNCYCFFYLPDLLKGLCHEMNIFWRFIKIYRYFLYSTYNFLLLSCWKNQTQCFSLLLWNYLLILKILSVTRFKDP